MLAISPLSAAAIAVTTLALVGTHWKAYHSGHKNGANEIQVAWDQNLKDIAENTAKQIKIGADNTKRLQAEADKARGNSDAQIKNLSNAYESLIAGLSHHSPRPSGDSSNLPTATGAKLNGCTPRELYREDAAMAVKLAADAERLRIEYQRCKAGYDEIKSIMNKGP